MPRVQRPALTLANLNFGDRLGSAGDLPVESDFAAEAQLDLRLRMRGNQADARSRALDLQLEIT